MKYKCSYHINADKALSVPRCRIDLLVSDIAIDGEIRQLVERAYVELLDREQGNTKEYPMTGTGASVFYNKQNKITSLLIRERVAQTQEERDGQIAEELEKFLELAKDEEALEAYRLVCYFWATHFTGMESILDSMGPNHPLYDENAVRGEEDEAPNQQDLDIPEGTKEHRMEFGLDLGAIEPEKLAEIMEKLDKAMKKLLRELKGMAGEDPS